MRALFVVNNPVYGGAHNELLGQRPGMEAAGWELEALTSDEPATGQERLRAAGVQVTTIPLHRLRATKDPRPHLALAAGLLPEVNAIRRVIRERGIDLVQVHGPTNFHGAIAAHRENVAVCWHIYDEVAPPALLRVLMPPALRLADSVTTIGRALAESHPGVLALGERCVVTSPPVDFTRYAPDPARRAAARAELEIPDGAIAIGTVGNRNPTKGHNFLVDAAARLMGDHPEVVVRIMGARSPVHGEYERSIHEAIAARGLGDRIRLLEPGARVAELLPGLDLFAMTSVPRSEGMPTSILEAMGCALPVVATDVGAVAEEIDEGGTGFVVAPLDPAGIAAALGRLVADAGLRERMGAAGRERALARFSSEIVVANRLRAYAAALGHRRARTPRRSRRPAPRR
jgi:glycosyltransferase involved in cell wall biosynthesis